MKVKRVPSEPSTWIDWTSKYQAPTVPVHKGTSDKAPSSTVKDWKEKQARRGPAYKTVKAGALTKPPRWYEDKAFALRMCVKHNIDVLRLQAEEEDTLYLLRVTPRFICVNCQEAYDTHVMAYVIIEYTEQPTQMCFYCARQHPLNRIVVKLLGLKHQG